MQNPSQHCPEQALKIHQSCCSLAFVAYRISHSTKTIVLCSVTRAVFQLARLYGNKPFPSICVAQVYPQSKAGGGVIFSPHSTQSQGPASKLDSSALVSVRKRSAKPRFCDQDCVSTKHIICSVLYTPLVFLWYGGVCFGVFQFLWCKGLNAGLAHTRHVL